MGVKIISYPAGYATGRVGVYGSGRVGRVSSQVSVSGGTAGLGRLVGGEPSDQLHGRDNGVKVRRGRSR